MVIQAQGRYEEAEEIYRQALEILNRLLGPEHPYTKGVKENLEIVEREARG
jgi:tetratricopeptide (TPR) repeat protein